MKTILLVDDNDLLIRTYSLALHQRGYHVIQAASGGAGLSMARKYLPDLIVSDIDMPGGDGAALLRDNRAEHDDDPLRPGLRHHHRPVLLQFGESPVVGARHQEQDAGMPREHGVGKTRVDIWEGKLNYCVVRFHGEGAKA